MCRALRRALAAAGTLCVIDHSNVVIHMNRIEFTLLCAERTSDTACLADLLDSRSFVVGAALYKVVCLIRNELDQVTRTSLCALTTGNALLLVDNGNTVYNMDRVKLTCLYTASGTETSKGTLVWEIVALHNGKVRVEESSEKGTAIAVKFPTDAIKI